MAQARFHGVPAISFDSGCHNIILARLGLFAAQVRALADQRSNALLISDKARLHPPAQSSMLHPMNTSLDPSAILQTAFGFWNSKVLLTAVEMGVFTRLGDRHLNGDELAAELGLHPRGIADFFDALAAMKFLCRDGTGASA